MFNWLTNLFGKRSLENPAVPASSPMAYEYLGGRRATSGVAVDRYQVLGYPACWRAVNLISHKVGKLPLNVYRRNKDGGREVDKEHPAEWLLSRRPSNLYTPFIFKSTMMAHALLHGNAYAWIIRDDNAIPQELVILDPQTTFPVIDNGQLYYVVRIGTTNRKLLPENIFHIKGLSSDGLVGISVIDVLREAFSIGIAAQRYGAVFFRNNGSPGPTILKMPTFLKDKDALKRFRDQWSYIHEGLDNSHRVAILEGGMELQTFQINHDDLQFLQTREFEVTQIASIFGVPPHKLGAKVTTSYGSLESEERAFLLDALDGWLCAWEEEAELKLLKESQAIRDSHFVEFDRRSLEQADYQTRSDTLIAEVNNGLRTENEGRALLNLPGVGPDGDRLRMPANITFIDLIGTEDDSPATDEPSPLVEDSPAEGDPDAVLPVESDPVTTPVPSVQGRLQALLTDVVTRFLNRASKAAVAASKRQEWASWLDAGLSDHFSLLADQLATVTQDADQHASRYLDAVRQELREVTRDQVETVFERIDPATWVKEILQ